MRVLIACEYSGTSRRSFEAAGHEVLSCDLLPADDGALNHYQGDVRDVLNQGWDMMIAHPPCTYLSVSGMHWTTRGLRDPQLTEDALDFVRLLLDSGIPKIALENPISVISSRIRKPDQIIQPWMFGDNASKKTCLWLKGLPKLQYNYADIVAPKGWAKVVMAADMLECEECGEPFCPEHNNHYADCDCIGPMEDEAMYKTFDGVLFATREYPAPKATWANQTPSGQNKLGPSADRWKIRSETYLGIAKAMAEQWGRQ
jgi:hypothetical protein